MLKTFESIAPHLKLKKKTISIDNLGAQLHYRATFLLLLAFTVLVTSRQYIGEHIRCMTGGSPTIPEHVINTFCFSTTTFTVVRHLNESMLSSGYVPHPGVGPMYKDEPVKYHGYYQWVPFILFTQAIMFYLPHAIWKSAEGGKIKTLVGGLKLVSLSEFVKQQGNLSLHNKTEIISYQNVLARVITMKIAFLEHMVANKYWAFKLVLIELLFALNLTVQIFFTNRFFRGQFFRLGIDFVRDDFKGIMDSLDIIFPKVTKCHFYKYGASGSIQRHDAICVMALNVINEKIFTFLWFWYCFLIVVTGMSLLWRLISFILHSRSAMFNGTLLALSNPGRVRLTEMSIITKYLNFNSWLFLHYLAINLDPKVFRNFLKMLVTELQEKHNIPENKLIESAKDIETDSIPESRKYSFGSDSVISNELMKLNGDNHYEDELYHTKVV